MATNSDDFTIIVDTREQHPWKFPYHTIANKKLDTGDYTIDGLEGVLCIERKNGIGEFANNMAETRFKDVIDRLAQCQHAFILLECNYDQMMNYPSGSTVPKKLWGNLRITPQFILKYINELAVHHNIHVIFCGCPAWAQKTALSIMKRVNELYGKKQS